MFEWQSTSAPEGEPRRNNDRDHGDDKHRKHYGPKPRRANRKHPVTGTVLLH
jgi:hypothetical protein